MKDLAIKAVVTSASGFYYREEHEWRNLSPAAASWFDAAEAKIVDHVSKAKHGKKTKGDLTVTLDATRDGVADKPEVIEHVDKNELKAFQRMCLKLGSDIIEK